MRNLITFSWVSLCISRINRCTVQNYPLKQQNGPGSLAVVDQGFVLFPERDLSKSSPCLTKECCLPPHTAFYPVMKKNKCVCY